MSYMFVLICFYIGCYNTIYRKHLCLSDHVIDCVQRLYNFCMLLRYIICYVCIFIAAHYAKNKAQKNFHERIHSTKDQNTNALAFDYKILFIWIVILAIRNPLEVHIRILNLVWLILLYRCDLKNALMQ